jgi:hypothetical protein
VGLSRPLPSSWPGGRVSFSEPARHLTIKRAFFATNGKPGTNSWLNRISPHKYNSFLLDEIYGIMRIYLLNLNKDNTLK